MAITEVKDKDARDPQDAKRTKDVRDGQKSKEVKDGQKSNDTKDAKKGKETKDPKKSFLCCCCGAGEYQKNTAKPNVKDYKPADNEMQDLNGLEDLNDDDKKHSKNPFDINEEESKLPLLDQSDYQGDTSRGGDNVNHTEHDRHLDEGDKSKGLTSWSTPTKSGFLVSFIVDARGGAMTGSRGSGMRLILPPGCVEQPVRLTCRYVRHLERLQQPNQSLQQPHHYQQPAPPPPLMEREALASRIVQTGPAGTRFLNRILLEIPHFASLRDGEREVVVLRCDGPDEGQGDGPSWTEHRSAFVQKGWEGGERNIYQDVVAATGLPPAHEELYTDRVVRVSTSMLPRYLAILSRVRQQVHTIGPEGGKITAANQQHIQVFFPKGALTKKIKVALQVQKVPEALASPFQVRASPLAALEPRRRRFHCPVQIMLHLPKLSNDKANPSKIHLMCSLTGSASRAHWEDVTNDTPFVVKNDSIIFETRVSALFWAIAVPDHEELESDYEPLGGANNDSVNESKNKLHSNALNLATHLYNEMVLPPYMAKVVVLFRPHTPHAWCDCLRVVCVTDDRAESYWNDHKAAPSGSEWEWQVVAISEEMEVSTSNQLNFQLEKASNLEIATDCQLEFGYRQFLIFEPFQENWANLLIKVKDKKSPRVGRLKVTKSFKYVEKACHVGLCTLDINLHSNETRIPSLPELEENRIPALVLPLRHVSMVSHVVSWHPEEVHQPSGH